MKRKVFSVLFLGGLMVSSVYADVLVGFKVSNNLWKDHWIITPAMEITFGGKWFMIEGDGTYGIHEITKLERGYAYQLSYTLTPMFRVPIVGPFYGALGYGVNYTYRREELLADDGKYLLASEELIRGQAQGFLGAAFPLTQNMKIYAHGGASYIDKSNLSIFGTVGLNLRWPLPYYPSEFAHSGHSSSANHISPEVIDIILQAPPEYRPRQRERIRLAIIGSDDPIVFDFISSFQTSLLEEGIKAYNWNKINLPVDAYYRQTNLNTIPADSLSSVSNRNRHLSIALEGAKLFDLDGLIDFQLKYENKKNRSVPARISNAIIRLINPQTGEILWATEYRGGDQEYDHSKKMLTQSLIKAVRQWYK
ncbi:MAG TPA: hypothetical protein ENN03_04580 [bacterium]|nr:hypothetical protein [bacterium]